MLYVKFSVRLNQECLIRFVEDALGWVARPRQAGLECMMRPGRWSSTFTHPHTHVADAWTQLFKDSFSNVWGIHVRVVFWIP